jgi:hypothetical protein
MRFLSLAVFISAVLGIASGAAHCVSNGCECDKGIPGGSYCGYCAEVNNKGKGAKWSDVFHCAKNTGKCCRYGPRKSCKSGPYLNYGPCGAKKEVVV